LTTKGHTCAISGEKAFIIAEEAFTIPEEAREGARGVINRPADLSLIHWYLNADSQCVHKMLTRSHCNGSIYHNGAWEELPVSLSERLFKWRTETLAEFTSRKTQNPYIDDEDLVLFGERIRYNLVIRSNGTVQNERIYLCETKRFFDPVWRTSDKTRQGVSGFYP
jgi:hypothetical protein